MEAKNILISITGCPKLSLKEIENAMDIIQTRISSASRVLGVTTDNKLQDENQTQQKISGSPIY